MKNTLAIFLFILFASAIQAQDTTIDKGSGWLYFTGVPGTTPSVTAGSEVAINTLTREAYIWNRDSSAWQPWLLIDSVTFAADTLRIYENGSTTPFEVAISTADGNGLFSASNDNDTVRISTALLRAGLTFTQGSNAITFSGTGSNTMIASNSSGVSVNASGGTYGGLFSSGSASGVGLRASSAGISGVPLQAFNGYTGSVDAQVEGLRLSRSGIFTGAPGNGIYTSYYTRYGYTGILETARLSAISRDTSVTGAGDLIFYIRGSSGLAERARIAGADGQLTLPGYASTGLTSADSSLYVLTTDETGDVWKTSAAGLGGASSFGILTSAEGSFSAALAAVSASKKTIIIDDAQTLSANATIPDSVTLFFVDGGSIDLNGDTLTLYGAIQAPLQQIFVENGGVITGQPKTTTWYPEWFGAKAEAFAYTTNETLYDDHDAIQAALNVLKNTGGGRMELQAGNYHNLESLLVPDNSTIVGAGINATHIWAANDTASMTWVYHPAYAGIARFSHFYLGNAWFTDAGENISISNLSAHCYDSAIGFSLYSTKRTSAVFSEPTNATTGATDAAKNIYINNVGAYDVLIGFGIAPRAQGNETPESSGFGYNENINVTNCIIDSTSNKAIEFQEVSGGLIANNYITHAEDGIQVIHFCKNVNIVDNEVNIGGGGWWGDKGIFISNSSDDIFVSRNIVRILTQNPKNEAAYATGALVAKFDYDDAAYSMAWEETHISNGIHVVDNIFDVSEVSGADVFGFVMWGRGGGERAQNWTFSNNEWRGGALNLSRDTSSVLQQDNVYLENFVFDGDRIGDIFCESAAYTSDVTFRNCTIEGPSASISADTIDIIANDWLFQGCDIAAILQFLPGSSNVRMIGNIVHDTLLSSASVIKFANYNVIAPDTLLLDNYSGADLAVSMRKLKTNYAGDAMQVTRASDNTTQSIGFSGEFMDTTSLKTFCAGTDCYVNTWYDQSGNGNNFTEADTSDMPKIVAGGNIIYVDGHPSISFRDSAIMETASPILTDPFTVFAVAANVDTTTSSSLAFQYDVNNSSRLGMYLNRGVSSGSIWSMALQVGTLASGGTSVDEGVNIYTWIRNGTTVDGWRNGAQQITNGTTGSGNAQAANLSLFNTSRTDAGANLDTDGNISELIIWNGETKGSDRAAIETNINSHYGSY